MSTATLSRVCRLFLLLACLLVALAACSTAAPTATPTVPPNVGGSGGPTAAATPTATATPRPLPPALDPASKLARNCEQYASFAARPMVPGQLAIDFTLKDTKGKEYALSSMLAQKPVVMIFGSFT